MRFHIKQLILWSKDGEKRRVVNFKPGVINVISGGSKTGKSAVIPIIDYCLTSDRCAIPVGVIREKCGWFGIVLHTLEGEKLLARREPGAQQQTGDMFVLEGPTVEVPLKAPQKNTTAAAVRSQLDRLAGVTNLGFDPQSESGYKTRPSFRDLMAFTFQPQNIVANADVMFFKADTTEHREKLRTIFPYVIGAVTPEVLAARFELDRLQKALRRKEAELQAALVSVNAWQAEATAWVRQAIEYGLLPANTAVPAEWIDVLQLLRTVAKGSARSARPTLKGIDSNLKRLADLREAEAKVAGELSESRQKLNEINRLLQSSQSYGQSIKVQRDRLSLSTWLQSRIEDKQDALAVIGASGRDQLAELCRALEGIELQLRSHPSMSDTLQRERLRLRTATEEKIVELESVRTEIENLERKSAEAREEAYRLDSIERYLGRLEQALSVYDRADVNANLRQDIDSLGREIKRLRGTISEQEIKRRTDNALKTIESLAGGIIPKLDAEWPNAPIKLLIDDLTIKVIQGTRDDYLWEIGSGANWLAYHVALTLALQKFFLTLPNHPVPSFLIYDQPSQVYFPRRLAGKSEQQTDPKLTDEDVVAVRKVFLVLGAAAIEAGGRLQAVVLDHADEEVWGQIPGVELVEEWRGQKLVPLDW
jgi:hypothetical protein